MLQKNSCAASTSMRQIKSGPQRWAEHNVVAYVMVNGCCLIYICRLDFDRWTLEHSTAILMVSLLLLWTPCCHLSPHVPAETNELQRADPERGGVKTVSCSLEHRRGENSSFTTRFHGGSNLLQAAGVAALAKHTFKIHNFHPCCHLVNCGSPSPGKAEPLWNVYILRLGRKLLWHFF